MSNKKETGLQSPEEIIATEIKNRYTDWDDQRLDDFDAIEIGDGKKAILSGKIIRSEGDDPRLTIKELEILNADWDPVRNHQISVDKIEDFYNN